MHSEGHLHRSLIAVKVASDPLHPPAKCTVYNPCRPLEAALHETTLLNYFDKHTPNLHNPIIKAENQHEPKLCAQNGRSSPFHYS
jgi:galactose-1-phosphate uridylyltransferase